MSRLPHYREEHFDLAAAGRRAVLRRERLDTLPITLADDRERAGHRPDDPDLDRLLRGRRHAPTIKPTAMTLTAKNIEAFMLSSPKTGWLSTTPAPHCVPGSARPGGIGPSIFCGSL